MKISNFRFGILALVLVVLIGACASTTPIKPKISGKIIGAEEETLKMFELKNNNLTEISSTLIDKKGKFTLENNGLEPNFYYLGFDKKEVLLLFTDSTENVTIEATKENIKEPTSIKGSPNSVKYMDFQKLTDGYGDQLRAIDVKLKTQISNTEKLTLQKDKTALLEEKRTASKKFIDENKGNPITLVALQGLDFNKDLKYFDRVISDTKKTIGGTKLHDNMTTQIKNIKKQMAAPKKQAAPAGMAPGTAVPEIDMAGIDGGSYKLSDLKGKVVLIDFWASWCGPCRRENPNVVAAYNKYNKDGFEVFSVSLDGNLDRWKQAIENDGLIWPYHVSDLKKWGNEAAKAYGVHSIPHGVLIDRDGKVIQEKLRGQALQDKLAEIFGH